MELWPGAGTLAEQRAGAAVSRLAFTASRPQLLQQHAARAGTRSDPSAAAEPIFPGPIRTIQNDEIANYEGLSVVVRQRMTHGVQFLASYTWSHTLDVSADSNGGGTPMNPSNWRADYGNSNWDIRHRLTGGDHWRQLPVVESSPHPDGADSRNQCASRSHEGSCGSGAGTPGDRRGLSRRRLMRRPSAFWESLSAAYNLEYSTKEELCGSAGYANCFCILERGARCRHPEDLHFG